MGFNKVYKVLQEIFPEVDSRILRAVAIEHCKDADTAVEVVLSEVIPCLTGKSKVPSTSSGQSEVAVSSSEAAVNASGAPQTDAALLHSTKDSDEQKNALPFYDASCGHHQTFEDTEGESHQHYHDAVGVDDVVFEGNGSGALVSMEKCDESNDKISACEPLQVTTAMSNAEYRAAYDIYELSGHSLANKEKCVYSASPESTSSDLDTNRGDEVAYNQLCQPLESVVLCNTLGGTDNSSCDGSAALMSNDDQDMKHPESQLASLNIQTALSGSESSIELVLAPNAHNFELEIAEADLNDSFNATSNKDLSGEMLVSEEELMPHPVVTASGQICSIDLLEDMITEAKSNKKTLFSAVESVICLMREVELQEEGAEQAKQDAAKGGLDLLRRVEDLKEMLRHAKEANDMHAGEVYGEKAILATEVKELQSRLLGLADERDKSLAVLDEMRQTLEVRIAAAEKEMQAAEKERLDKEEDARKALTDQEIIMEKVVQESNTLKKEAEENAKLRDFLVDRGRVVDTLQGEIAVICKDVRLLKEKFDDHVPLSKSLCSSQTSCILASSSSSLKSVVPDQVPDSADLLDAEEKMDISSYHEEHQESGVVKPVINNKDLSDDDWEIFDKPELSV